MMRSLYSGVSGLKNHQTNMDVVGNNIANVNTTGFKRSRTNFQNLLSQNISSSASPNGMRGGINGKQVGLGISMASIDIIVMAGNTQYTGSALDMAIEGDGYFILQNGNNKLYTRAGTFDMDTDGNIISTNNGMKVMGWMADKNGKLPNSLDINSLGTLKVPIGTTIDAKATTAAAYTKNIDSNTEIGKTYSTSLEVFDSLGNAQSIQIDFEKTDINQWTVKYKIPNNSNCRYQYTGAQSLTSNDPIYSANNVLVDIKTLNPVNNVNLQGQLNLRNPTNDMIYPIPNDNTHADGLLRVGQQPDIYVKVPITYDASNVTDGTLLAGCTGVGGRFQSAIHQINIPLTGNASDLQLCPNNLGALVPVGGNAYAHVDLNYDARSLINNNGQFTGPFYDANGNPVNVWKDGFNIPTSDSGDATTDLDIYSPGNTSGLINVGTYYDKNGTVQNAYCKVAVSDNAFTMVTLTTLNFDSSGRIIDNDGTNDNKVIYSIQNYQSYTINKDANGDIINIIYNNADPMNVTIDFTNLTQYAEFQGEMSTALGVRSNGYPAGTLQTISADSSGVITGSFSNGETMKLAQVAIACFNNPGGLTSIGGNLFSISNNSGKAQIGAAGNGGRGTVAPNTLEMSNVNLSDEFTNMIVTQRGFQASSRLITTTDTMLEELVNLKR